MYADLHTHTTASDGSFTPTELVHAAKARNLSVLAVTDHDTTAGLVEAARACDELGIRLVPGLELSAEGPPGKCHLLGLRIDPTHTGLQQTLANLSRARRERNARIAERLQTLGVPLTLEEVAAVAPPGANIGRPHFAQVLVQKGVVMTLGEAFERFLADGAAAYVPKAVLTPPQTIALIHQAGGLAFLAHPFLVRLEPYETLRDRVRALQEVGLNGIEAYYSQHTGPQTTQMLALARELRLLVSGGSDFHGATKPAVALGAVVDGHGVPLGALPVELR